MHVRLLLPNEIKKHGNANDAVRNICDAMSGPIFSKMGTELSDKSRPGRSAAESDELLLKPTEENLGRDTCELAEQFQWSRYISSSSAPPCKFMEIWSMDTCGLIVHQLRVRKDACINLLCVGVLIGSTNSILVKRFFYGNHTPVLRTWRIWDTNAKAGTLYL